MNEATISDAKAAQSAVDAATSVLQEFYKKAATATALLQKPPEREWRLMGGAKMGTDEWKELANPGFAAEDSGHKEGMQTFGEAYSGQQNEARSGVLAILEVIAADFLRLDTDTAS